MAISSIGSSTQAIADSYYHRRSGLDDLKSAVQAGNLQGAQQALAALPAPPPITGGDTGAIRDARERMSSMMLDALSGQGTAAPSRQPQMPEGLQAVFDAVEKGDMSAAQAALQALEEDVTAERSGAPLPPPPPPPQSGLMDGLQSIFDAVQSGDLETAQEALTAFNQKIEQNGSASEARDDLAGELGSLFDAVRSGDIDAAQDALASLQDRMSAMALHAPPPPSPELSNDLLSLFDALESGNIDGAQNALASLLDGGSDPTAGETSTQTDRIDAFKSLLEAVKSGDLETAQNALSSITSETTAGSDTGGLRMLMLAQRAYSEWQAAGDAAA